MNISLAATADFVRAHWPASQAWNGDLEKWLTWASHKGFLIQICDGDKLAGLAIARPVAGINGKIDNNDWHDDRGDYVFCDLVIAQTRMVRQAVGLGIVARFGQRKYVAFRRKGKLKVHSMDRARKALLR